MLSQQPTSEQTERRIFVRVLFCAHRRLRKDCARPNKPMGRSWRSSSSMRRRFKCAFGRTPSTSASPPRPTDRSGCVRKVQSLSSCPQQHAVIAHNVLVTLPPPHLPPLAFTSCVFAWVSPLPRAQAHPDPAGEGALVRRRGGVQLRPTRGRHHRAVGHGAGQVGCRCLSQQHGRWWVDECHRRNKTSPSTHSLCGSAICRPRRYHHHHHHHHHHHVARVQVFGEKKS
jgi:hypothetical protein